MPRSAKGRAGLYEQWRVGGTSPHSINRNTKLGRILSAFLEGRRLNRFEAALEFSDWCLNSTVSDLQRRGLVVARQWETIPGFNGRPTRCCRYWLPESERKNAKALLGVDCV